MSKEKKLFGGRLISLYSVKTRLPNGYTAELEVIKHPGAALVVPFLDKDTIIMLKQLRPVIGASIYELPAGTRDGDESTRACAAREIIEETGYSAGKLKKIGKIYPVPGYSTECIDIYKAWSLQKRPVSPEQDEIIKSFAVRKSRIRAMFRSGSIVDAKTICALAFIGWI